MEINAFAVAFLAGLSIFMLLLLVSVLSYNSSLKESEYVVENNRRKKIYVNENEWLFSNFYLKIYDMLFGEKSPEKTASSVGVNVKDYLKYCEILRIEPNLKKIIIYKFYGFFAFFVFIILAVLWTPAAIILGIPVLIYLAYFEEIKTKSAAESKKKDIENDLPRFLDLLSTELEIGMPIETAIFTLSKNLKCTLSDEFIITFNEIKLTSKNWSEILEILARKYEIQMFSDFVLDVTTSYKKGVSVADSVKRKAQDIREEHLLVMKSRAGRMTNTIMLPVAVFQLMPLLAFLMFPSITQLKGF